MDTTGGTKSNDIFDASSVTNYLTGYANALLTGLTSVNGAALQRACDAIVECSHAGHRVYAIGNGGSAAIADHLSCDWTKGTHDLAHPVIDTQSLSANTALFSAIANDYDYSEVFARQVAYFGRPGDILVAISSSGGSPNVLNAVRSAREVGMLTIGLTGFDGGSLASEVHHAIHVPMNNYGVVEDAHQAVMHVIAQYIVAARGYLS